MNQLNVFAWWNVWITQVKIIQEHKKSFLYNTIKHIFDNTQTNGKLRHNNTTLHNTNKARQNKTLRRWPEKNANKSSNAAPCPVFHAISTKHDCRAIYNCRRTACRQLNVYLNQINRFIKNISQINFYLKSIKFSYWVSMQRFIEFK